MKVRLKDSGIAVDWLSLSDIKAYIYSDVQKAIAGRCTVSIDGSDSTLLICEYAATKPQYLGANSIVIRATYDGRVKTYDKPAFAYVKRTADVAGGAVTVDDPVVEVTIEVADVSTSLLDMAIALAFQAVAEWDQATITERGPEGKSAYREAVDNGFVGTEAESLKGETGADGPIGPPGVTSAEVAVTNSTGTPAAEISVINGVLSLILSGIKGETGPQGPQGVQGIQGIQGPVGPAGVTSVVVNVENSSGTPAASTSLANGVLTINISGIKGLQGNSGYTGAAGELEVVNNDDDGGEEAAWSAERGKVVAQKMSMVYPYAVKETNYDVDDAPKRNYQINSSNKYTTNPDYKHIILPVVPGAKIRVVAAGSNQAQLAWLKNGNAPVSGGTPAFVDDTTRFNQPAGTAAIYTVPEGAAFLYCYAGQSHYAFLPDSVAQLESTIVPVVDNLETDAPKESLSARQGVILERGHRLAPLVVSRVTGLQITELGYFQANSSSSYVVYYVPVNRGEIVHYKASNTEAKTIRAGFCNDVPAAGAGLATWNYNDNFGATIDYQAEAPFDGYFVVYHYSTYYTDQQFTVEAPTSQAAKVAKQAGDMGLLLDMFGGDYDRVIPAWFYGKFVYYNQSGTAGSASLAFCNYEPTRGRKYLYFTQNVSTGDGTAGIRFYDSEKNDIIGFRQVIEAEQVGLRRVILEVPSGAAYFRATCYISKLDEWFGYLFDDERLANLIRKAENTKHIKVCLLGNSYTADAWRYVPKMLLQYGITMESFFYYRGQGSLYDLDTQWEDDSATGTSDYDGAQHSRITFYVNSANDPVWRNYTRHSATWIVAARQWDIISLQQGGNRCKDIESYAPSLQNVINKIEAACPYPHTLCWYMAYNGATQNIQDGMKEQSLATQHLVIKGNPFGLVIPAAAAVFNAQANETLGALGGSMYRRMYAPDNVHMQEGLPCYVAACAVVQALLNKYRPGETVMGDQFRATASAIANLGMTQTANGTSTGVTDANCFLAQRAAILANNNQYEIIPA